jgi:hypothetical protein
LRKPREFEREIRLYRRVYFRGTLRIDVPASVRQLPRENVVHALLLELEVDLPGPMHERDVIGTKGRVDYEFAKPISIRILKTD